MSEDQDIGFALAVHNPLLGVFNYIVLNLPTGWRVKPGDFPPEVYSSTKIEDVRWVREGTSTNYIYYDKGNALRVQVKILQDRRDEDMNSKKLALIEKRSVFVNGHEAKTLTGRISRGLMSKKTFEYIRIIMYCDVTRRTIDLTMEGHCNEPLLKSLVDKLQLSKCH